MKNKNLLNWLWTDSHEKQSPQRFARYAAILIMLLTLGVGQMWAWQSWYMVGEYQGSWSSDDKVNLDGTIANGKYFLPVYHDGSKHYFRLWSDNNYGPSSSKELPSGGEQGGYNGDSQSWYISSSEKKLICICVDQNGDNREWNPWVWARDAEVYLKHTWSSSSWTYSDKMTVNTTNGTYTLDRNYPTYSSNNGYNCSIVPATDGGTQRDGAAITPTKVGSPASGNKCRYVYDASAGTLTITKLCTVKYNGNDKTSGTVPSDDADNLYDTYITLSSTTLTKSGYTHTGWNTAADGSGTHYDKGASFQVKEATQTLYAEWTQTVTLDANTLHGGSGANGSATATWNGTALSSISHPSGATGYTRTGYFTDATEGTKVLNANGTFAGSNISGYITSGKWSRTTSTTLYAQWDNHYTVTFNDHEATIHGTTETTATYGEAMPAITIPRKDGYIFGGYYTGTDGSGTQYYNADGSSANNWAIASNTTLHAHWTGIAYHVSFSANGGTGSMSDQDLTYGTSTPLTSNTYTREGYYFLGWNTNADGSGTAYYNGKSVSAMTTIPGETVTLYAQWAKTHTLYFLNMGVDGWRDKDQGDGAAGTTRYAYAFISYDGHEMYPLGTYATGTRQGTKMTAVSDIRLTNVNNGQVTWCWSIANVPEGATIIFSDNTDSHKSGDQSGWSADKPYFCNGNSTWYAVDENDASRISAMTEMSVYIGAGDFGSWKFYALDKHGDDSYAIIWLNTNQTYQYKYYNWRTGSYSGATAESAYIINGGGSVDVYGPWGLNGDKDVMVKTNTHASGEYKFLLTWSGGTPQTTVRVPRGVNLTTTSPTQAKQDESVTVSFTADAWKNLSSGTDKSSLTYYFEFSTDNSNWTTIATVGPVSDQLQANASYTFNAQSGYFRVKLVNANGVASYSGSTAFTAYTTKSFYVYNPYNNASDKWQTLHLYTWNSAGSKPTYNGSFPGGDASSCINGNAILSKGGDWFYITIDERADKFQLVGDADYNTHKTVDCSVSNYIQDAKYMIETVSSKNYVNAYKAKGASDYRLKYTGSGGTRYSNIYNTILDGTTVISSMWMNANDATASLAIEQGTGSDTWAVRKTYSNDGKDGFDGLVDSDHRDHGYVFQMNINFNSGDPASSTINNVAVYNGPFYVRTDGLDGGWNVYEKKDHMMHYSEHSLNGSPAYNYYLCKWINEAGTNVKFTVANDYNKELVESLEGDASLTDPLYGRQTIPSPTNVRFSWNSQTNTLTRAYLSAATDASSRFLVMIETSDTKGKIYKEDGNVPTGGNRISGLNDYELIFNDKGNWVYQLIIMANPGAKAKVTAKYNGEEPEFIPSTTLIGGSGSTKYTYRIVYDFKTNELTNAWVADGNKINESIELNTNVMLVRNGQNAATQLTFGEDKKITQAKKLIGVMEFRYNDMVGKMSSWNSTAYQNCMYYFSFPFDVKVSDIFGVGEMGTDWRIQKYNGAKRALIGWFADTDTFWEDVTAGDTLNAYEGYSLLLNRINFNNGSSDVWANISSGGSVYLYFPSDKSNVGTIKVNDDIEITVPSHVCNIDRDFAQDMALDKASRRNHRITDSNWNMLGSALFENKEGSTVVPNKIHEGTEHESILNYIYAWNSSDNSLSIDDLDETKTFMAMHAYLVQFAGKVTFRGASITPALAAARQTVEKKNYKVKLELSKGEIFAGRTYVELRENAVDSFLLNEDMYMLKNSKIADIYTYAGGYDVAANVLTEGNHIVPVGVNVKSAGEYTFSMPSNFSGEVILIDTYNNTRTNLAIEDYEVSLSKGAIEDRFKLEINIRKVPTAIDGVTDGSGSLRDGKAHKFIQNGQMYILKDCVIYDARGNRVK